MRERIGRLIGFVFLLCMWVLIFLLVAVQPSHAQTAPSGQQFAVSGSYASSSGNNTNNGMQNTVEWNMAGRWGARIDMFGLNRPAGATWSLAQGQYKIPGDRLFKTADPTFQKLTFGLHAGLGVFKSPSGAASFAVGAGVSVDYSVTNILFVRVLDVTDGYSRGVGNIGPVGNYVDAGVGFGFRF